ncbi:ABC-F family ATP-binding cassette domain-containing protein [Candidatus Parcubacteria bacterium]|nr:ABC-F family ATP-binding cassette domain-containing protein [Candidatus Parcubacteria bacterium]
MNKTTKIKNPVFVLRNASKSYGNQDLFSDANLTVNFNHRIAIVGPNGIGKSALLKTIIGLEELDDGNIIKNKDLKIGYLSQETHWKSLENTLSQEINSENLKENKLNNNYRYKGLVEKFLDGFGFSKESFQRKIKTLSGGERTKLALAKILAFEPNLLVLDEPTNHLDLETIEWLEELLLKWKQAIICVSHDRYFLDKICDKTFELTKKGLDKYYCAYSEHLKEKDKRFERKEREYKNQQKYFKKQQIFIDRFRAKACAAKAVRSRIKQLGKLEQAEKPETFRDIKIGFDIGIKTCTKVLEINNLIVGRKQAPLFKTSGRIEVNWGDKIGIIGKNGAGKSTLLKSILNMNELVKGKINTGQGIEIGYYAQAHEELDPKKTIMEEIASKTTAQEEKIRSVLGCLLFTQNQVSKKIDSLSGGERARVALAELILEKSNFLLLDEPTNHLDLPSKEVVTNMLKEFKGAILLVSHDRYILNNVCNMIWEISDGKLKRYIGNYEDYRYNLNL